MTLDGLILKYFPGCDFNCDEENILYWDTDNPMSQPTIEEIAILKPQYKIYLDSMAYQILRKEEYPSWYDQLDLMYHDQVNGTTTWKDAIKAVKDKYPKGN